MIIGAMLRWSARVAAIAGLAAAVGCGGGEASAKSPDMATTTVARESAGSASADTKLDEEDSKHEGDMLAGAAPPAMYAQNQPAPGPQAPGQPPAGGQPGPPPAGKKAPEPLPKGAPGQTSSDVARVQSPMLLYTAQITMAVFEVKKALAAVEDLGRDMGGFLARRDDQTITIRVPAARFDEAVARLEKLGDMIHRNVTAEDVTEEFNDLEVRLKSARAVRDRLEQLLGKAAKVEESVLIERELERVAGEIERIEGRMKFLKDRAAYSTITVSFQARRSETLGSRKFNLPVPWLYELGLSRLLAL